MHGPGKVVLVAVSLVVTVSAAPTTLPAQLPSDSRVTLDVYGGLSTFGRFLEQSIVTHEREVQGANSTAFGAALGIQPWERTGLRVAVTWAPTELDLVDDTGPTRDTSVERPAFAQLDALIVSIEAATLVLGDFSVFRPYTLVGVAGGWWMLGDQSAPELLEVGTEDSKLGFGGTGGLGLEVGLTDSLLLRLEAAQIRLINPFDGHDAWRVGPGFTIDEPSTVRISRYSLGLGFSFGG